jgi:peptidylprolyl isomerase
VRRLLVLLVAALLLLTTAACGGGGDSSTTKTKPKVATGDTIKGLAVSGDFGKTPVVKVSPAVKVTKPRTRVVKAGTGPAAKAGKKVMFDFTIAKGSDGSKVYSDIDAGTPQQRSLTEGQFFKPVIAGLVGKPRGSRVVIADTVQDLWGAQGAPQLKLKKDDTVILVMDVLSVEPTAVASAPKGKTVAAPATAPKVVSSGGKVTGIDFSKAPKKAPTTLQVIPLIEGTGPKVPAGRLTTFNYYGAVWGSKKPFDSSFSRGAPTPFGIGVGGLIPAWDTKIPGLKVGSRVLIIAPPSSAYGSKAQNGIPANSTLAFVVDVLGADA